LHLQIPRIGPVYTDRLFAESKIRAIRHKNLSAALDLALCHGYGIGTTQSWPDCIKWLETAAASGNEPTLIYLKRVRPEIQFVETDGSIGIGGETNIRVSDFLLQRCRWHLDKGPTNLIDALRILNLLRDTEPEVYATEHATLRYCCCRPPVQRFEKPFTIVLSHVWAELSHSFEKPMADELTIAATRRDEDGQTLMHVIAACSHPPIQIGEPDIIRRIGEIVVGYGCHLDDPDLYGKTPLSLAIEVRNFPIIDLLVQLGVIVPCGWDQVRLVAWQYDYEILQKILPAADLAKQSAREDPNKPFAIQLIDLIYSVIAIHPTQGKLEHGDNYPEGYVRTVEVLCLYASQQGIDVWDWIDTILESVVIWGVCRSPKLIFGARVTY
jgi:hypothetical protein